MDTTKRRKKWESVKEEVVATIAKVIALKALELQL